MSLWKIAWRSIQQRALASTLTGLSMALGVALVAAVLVIHGVVDRSFRRGAQGYDLIVGPKGSPLQLVLNTVYHMSEPVGKMPYRQYERVAFTRFPLPDGDLTERPAKAVPLCMGGNYQGFRVVGTTPEFFELEHHEGEYYEFATSGGQGRNMEINGYWEAVIGPTVARTAALEVGDTFQPRHGLDPDRGEEHRPFTVVGIFAPTGTPNDRALFINIDGFWLMHEHPDGDEEEHADSDAHQAAAGGDGHDVKTGPGGIRDIEFLVQGLQLVHLPAHPELLTGNTLVAIGRLVQGGVLTAEHGDALSADYALLRRTEHCLQILEDRRIHSVPRAPGPRTALARRVLGVEATGTDLESALEEIRGRTRALWALYME